MNTDLPARWHVGAGSAGDNRLDTAPKEAHFYWDSGREEHYSAEELRGKIQKEGRTKGDDPFVLAYQRLTGSPPPTLS